MNNIDKEELIELFFDRQLSEEQKENFKNLLLTDADFKVKVKEEALFRKVILEVVKEETLDEQIDFEAMETDTQTKLWYQKPLVWVIGFGLILLIFVVVLWFR
jgi:hypothetical protein